MSPGLPWPPLPALGVRRGWELAQGDYEPRAPHLPRAARLLQREQLDRSTIVKRVAPVIGGAPREIPGLIRPFGPYLLVREPSDELAVVDPSSGQKVRTLVPATCHGQLLHADGKRGLGSLRPRACRARPHVLVSLGPLLSCAQLKLGLRLGGGLEGDLFVLPPSPDPSEPNS